MKTILFLFLGLLCSSCFVLQAIQDQPYSYVYRDMETGKYDAGHSECYYAVGDTIFMLPEERMIVITSRYKVFAKKENQ